MTEEAWVTASTLKRADMLERLLLEAVIECDHHVDHRGPLVYALFLGDVKQVPGQMDGGWNWWKGPIIVDRHGSAWLAFKPVENAADMTARKEVMDRINALTS